MNQVQAMKDQNVRIRFIDCDAMEVRFANGVVLPIECFTDPADEVHLVDPVDGGWLHFGNDQAGRGKYPVKLITEEEWDAENSRALEASAAGKGRA